jgi:hypothetical protein
MDKYLNVYYSKLLFKILIVLITIVSLHILLHKLYHKKYSVINTWHFPMLFAICIETFIAL